MKYHIVINSVKTVDEFKDAWSHDDFINLLDRLNFPDAANSSPEELRDLLAMAISDFEPTEAAAIVLDYKFSDTLNENQIDQMSHEMLLDKICEEYADISYHHQLFNVNQLLHKAYNGTFPNAKATVIAFEITPNKNVTEEVVLKALSVSLAKSNVIKRLFDEQLDGKEAFEEAEDIAWDLKPTGGNGYILTTSEYWISRDEFIEAEFDAKVVDFEPDED